MCVTTDKRIIPINKNRSIILGDRATQLLQRKLILNTERKKKDTDASPRAIVIHSRIDIRDADESAALHNSSTGHSFSRPVGRKQTLNTW